MSKANFVQHVLKTKKKAEKGLQSVGSQIRTNLDAGQKKFDHSTRVNPIAGAREAFMRGYRK